MVARPMARPSWTSAPRMRVYPRDQLNKRARGENALTPALYLLAGSPRD